MPNRGFQKVKINNSSETQENKDDAIKLMTLMTNIEPNLELTISIKFVYFVICSRAEPQVPFAKESMLCPNYPSLRSKF